MIIFMSRKLYGNEKEQMKDLFSDLKSFENKLYVYLTVEFDAEKPEGAEKIKKFKNEIMDKVNSSVGEINDFTVQLSPSTELNIVVKYDDEIKKLLKILSLIRCKTTGEIFECTEKEYCEMFGETPEAFEKVGPAYLTTRIFKQGCCGNIAQLINLIFPDSEIVYCKEKGHLFAKFHGRYFDITGDITDEYKDRKIIKPDEVDIEDMTDNYDAFNNRPIL